jgi:hypothetical protein
MSTKPRGESLAWWSAATIFVSAFLLFQVQPVISKKILPWFGGSPAVWTTCVLFFQMLLLGGYSYAHLLIRNLKPNRQGLLHACLLLVAVAMLPIVPSDWWKPADGAYPAVRILALLAATVGIPYFLLSSTGPLIQAWFHMAYPGRSPYRLYALSNVGSLLALLSYPFWFEIAFPVDTQGRLWSLGFVLFAVLAGGWGLVMWRRGSEWAAIAEAYDDDQASDGNSATQGGKAIEVTGYETPTGGGRLSWVLLAALASMSLLAITNHLCQDIAVVPFMWIAPLSLYLISFIICFDRERWYSRKFFGLAGIFSIIVLAVLLRMGDVDAFFTERLKLPFNLSKPTNWMFGKMGIDFDALEFHENVIVSSTLYLTVLFLICMLCHGELVKSKPAPKYLTGFYLMISLGGALGGLFVALICPYVFPLAYELPLSLLCGFLVAWMALFNDGRETWLKDRPVTQWSLAFVLVGSMMMVASAVIDKPGDRVLALSRNFYGTLAVKTWGEEGTAREGRGLYHGRILHGFQYTDPLREMEPTTYYVSESGAGMAVEIFPRDPKRGMRVAVIGLGAGTMAAHGQTGDVYRFYDIDPKVIRLSDEFFTFRKNSKAKTEVILGDARIQMEREPEQNYDVIVVDAFSGDAIPAHLLTAEALKIYERHLRKDDEGNPEGIIAVHVSNRYLDLEPVVMALAQKFGYTAIEVHAGDGDDSGDTASDWVLLTRNQRFLSNPYVLNHSEPLALDSDPKSKKVKKPLLWTDQHSSLFEILK